MGAHVDWRVGCGRVSGAISVWSGGSCDGQMGGRSAGTCPGSALVPVRGGLRGRRAHGQSSLALSEAVAGRVCAGRAGVGRAVDGLPFPAGTSGAVAVRVRSGQVARGRSARVGVAACVGRRRETEARLTAPSLARDRASPNGRDGSIFGQGRWIPRRNAMLAPTAGSSPCGNILDPDSAAALPPVAALAQGADASVEPGWCTSPPPRHRPRAARARTESEMWDTSAIARRRVIARGATLVCFLPRLRIRHLVDNYKPTIPLLKPASIFRPTPSPQANLPYQAAVPPYNQRVSAPALFPLHTSHHVLLRTRVSPAASSVPLPRRLSLPSNMPTPFTYDDSTDDALFDSYIDSSSFDQSFVSPSILSNCSPCSS